MSGFLNSPVGIGVAVIVILVLILLAVTSMWKKVPQDKALVVTGLKK